MRGPPHVVIVGGGFGGLAAARRLAGEPVRVTLLDRTNHHLFQPLLYQVATGGLAAPAIAAPIRHILRRQPNATVLMAEVEAIDAAARELRLVDGERLGYDWLIVATGATHGYFGHDEWARHAPGLKTVDDAFDIRRRILYAFERAEREPDPARRASWLNFVVIGAGPTGVELAGTMAEIARHTLRGEFRRFDSRDARVILVEGGARVLSSFTQESSLRALEQLRRLGVDVRLDAKVTGIDAEGVQIGEQRLGARTVVWAAGVAASTLGRSLPAERDRAGRVVVLPDLSLPGHPEIFVVGDLAAATSDGRPVPGVAPAAKQMGHQAARNLLARLTGAPTQPFRYRDHGTLATIGRNAAVVEIGRTRLSGFPAWLFWLFVHVLFLIGFRSRLMVMTDFVQSYFTFKRSARIVAEVEPGRPEQRGD